MFKQPWKTITIDPSIKACGWAIWRYSHTLRYGYHTASGVIKSSPPPDELSDDPFAWVNRADRVIRALVHVARKHKAYGALIEHPQVFMSSHGQAASNAGSILKLCGFCHSLRTTLCINSINGRFVLVSKWKGNTPKRVTLHRILKRWQVSPADHNEADALGLGDWYLKNVLRYDPKPRHGESGIIIRV